MQHVMGPDEELWGVGRNSHLEQYKDPEPFYVHFLLDQNELGFYTVTNFVQCL